VGGKPANAKGLVDAHGNVWEWVANSRLDGAAGEQVIRGGGWNSTAAECRSASRTLIDETTTRNDIGFRVVMVRSPIPQIGECEYIVTLDGEEVYRATCYEGASCRDPGGSVGVTIGYDEGTLSWAKYEPRELKLIDHPETGCRTYFCGDCRCSVDCLCVTILDGGTPVLGEICDTSYSECDPPVWEGTVGDYELSVRLDRDENGDCVVIATVDGEEQEPSPVVGCADMSASIELYGVTIELVAKQCICGELPIYPCECRPDGVSGGIVEGDFFGPPADCAVVALGAVMQTEPFIAEAISEDLRMWHPDWVCRYMSTYAYKITAFPPLCVDPDVSRRVVFVKKTTADIWPPLGAANSTLEIEDWYVVVYTNNTAPRALLSINYNYVQCCKNETPEDAATSHLISVEFPGTDFGPWSYTLKFGNAANLALYGDC
jgi:hypothetical protein